METGVRYRGCIDVLSSCGGKYCDVLSWKRVQGVVVVIGNNRNEIQLLTK